MTSARSGPVCAWVLCCCWLCCCWFANILLAGPGDTVGEGVGVESRAQKEWGPKPREEVDRFRLTWREGGKRKFARDARRPARGEVWVDDTRVVEEASEAVRERDRATGVTGGEEARRRSEGG